MTKALPMYFSCTSSSMVHKVSWTYYGKCNEIGNYVYFPAVMYNF